MIDSIERASNEIGSTSLLWSTKVDCKAFFHFSCSNKSFNVFSYVRHRRHHHLKRKTGFKTGFVTLAFYQLFFDTLLITQVFRINIFGLLLNTFDVSNIFLPAGSNFKPNHFCQAYPKWLYSLQKITKQIAPGWARTTNLSVNSRTRQPIAPRKLLLSVNLQKLD